MMHRRPAPRRRRDPLFLGQPSPAVSKIARMNIARLEEYIGRCVVEVERLTKRIDSLKAHPDAEPEAVKSLEEQRDRVQALGNHARERLQEKHRRREHWEQRQHRPR